MAALSRGLRRAIVIVFLAFAAVGSYYAWTGPEGSSSAERAPLMVVESTDATDAPARSSLTEANAGTPVERPIAGPAGTSRTPASTTAEAVVAQTPPIAEPAKDEVVGDVVATVVIEDVIEILPPRAAAEFESAESESETVEPAGSDATAVRRHRVESGDTLSSIAARYYGDAAAWRRVAEANPTIDMDRLVIGTVLVVPAIEAALDAAPTPAVAAPEAPSTGRVHVVVEGETLSSIAASFYGDSSQWRRLYEANRGTIGADPGAIRVGMRLVVPAE